MAWQISRCLEELLFKVSENFAPLRGFGIILCNWAIIVSIGADWALPLPGNLRAEKISPAIFLISFSFDLL